jgi:ankyrin repeat protein
LLSFQVNLEAKGDGWTALLLACESEEVESERQYNALIEVVGLLLQAGARVNHTDAAGCSALMKAAEQGYEQTLKSSNPKNVVRRRRSKGTANPNIPKPWNSESLKS